MFRKIIVGILLLLICIINMAIASDGKECDILLILANTTENKVTYNVTWLDHNIDIYKGQYISRAGGEIQPYEMYNVSEGDFRLCLGRHRVTWYKTGSWSGMLTQYDFTLTKDILYIILSPNGIENDNS